MRSGVGGFGINPRLAGDAAAALIAGNMNPLREEEAADALGGRFARSEEALEGRTGEGDEGIRGMGNGGG